MHVYFNVLSNLSRTRAFSSGCSRIMTAGLWTTTYHISSTQSLLRRAGQVHPEPFRSCFRLEVWTLSSPVSCTRGVIAVPLNWGCVSPSLALSKTVTCPGPDLQSGTRVLRRHLHPGGFIVFFCSYTKGHSRFHIGSRQILRCDLG